MSNECSVLTKENGGRRRPIRVLIMFDRQSIDTGVQRVVTIINQTNAVLIAGHRIVVAYNYVALVYHFGVLSQKNVYSSLKRENNYYNVDISSLHIFNVHVIIVLLFFHIFFQRFVFLAFLFLFLIIYSLCYYRRMYNFSFIIIFL